MAAVLEFDLICKEFIDLKLMLQNFAIAQLEIKIEKIFSIDNWIWKNQQELQELSLIYKILEETKIVVINLSCSILKDLGIYIEKMNGEYVYNLWINTEGYPDLDIDKITPYNKPYFQNFYQIFEELEKEQNIGFRILGIGVETVFQYEEQNSDLIKKSKNMIAWLINKEFKNNIDLVHYKKKEVVGADFVILEK